MKESIGVSAGITAPVWLGVLNEYVACLVGIATLIYAICRIYFLITNKGK